MTSNDNNTGDKKMNATQTMILKDATKIIRQLRKLDQHKAAEELNLRVAKMIEDAA